MNTQENKCTMKAYAKINLMLNILGRRENGYHDLDMVMQQVSLADEVCLSLLTKKEENILKEQGAPILESVRPIFLKIIQESVGSDGSLNLHPEIAEPEKNIACLAVRACLEANSGSENKAGSGEISYKNTGKRYALLLEIRKNIPIAAGLAGGSTDAAAALILTNKLLRLGLSSEQLMQIGVKLGADVPYCILGGTARAEGIGEILTPLPPLNNCCILLVKPPIDVSTAWAYHEYDRLCPKLNQLPQAMIEALCSKNPDIFAISGLLGNVLELVTIPEYPEINDIKNKMKDLGALNAMMSGSGPTVFGIFREEEDAQTAAAHFKKAAYRNVFVTNCVPCRQL